MTNTVEPRPKRKKDKSIANFWRACRFLYPYRRIMAVSIVCALFVGAAFTGGLSSMLLPELRKLAGGLGIKSTGMKKAELVAAIRAAQSGGQGGGTSREGAREQRQPEAERAQPSRGRHGGCDGGGGLDQ